MKIRPIEIISILSLAVVTIFLVIGTIWRGSQEHPDKPAVPMETSVTGQDGDGLTNTRTTSVMSCTRDADHDGFITIDCGGRDCDDQDGAINPKAAEVENGIDDDCNSKIDQ